MPQPEEQLNVTVIMVDESMDFEWRITKNKNNHASVEMGDDFEVSPLFGETEDGMLKQVGTSSLIAACRLMGLTHEKAKMIAVLAIDL